MDCINYSRPFTQYLQYHRRSWSSKSAIMNIFASKALLVLLLSSASVYALPMPAPQNNGGNGLNLQFGNVQSASKVNGQANGAQAGQSASVTYVFASPGNQAQQQLTYLAIMPTSSTSVPTRRRPTAPRSPGAPATASSWARSQTRIS